MCVCLNFAPPSFHPFSSASMPSCRLMWASPHVLALSIHNKSGYCMGNQIQQCYFYVISWNFPLRSPQDRLNISAWKKFTEFYMSIYIYVWYSVCMYRLGFHFTGHQFLYLPVVNTANNIHTRMNCRVHLHVIWMTSFQVFSKNRT